MTPKEGVEAQFPEQLVRVHFLFLISFPIIDQALARRRRRRKAKELRGPVVNGKVILLLTGTGQSERRWLYLY